MDGELLWAGYSPLHGTGYYMVSAGSQQGNPLGPLVFALPWQDSLERLASTFPEVCQCHYLDDGLMFGPIESLRRVLGMVQACGADLGLNVNAASPL